MSHIYILKITDIKSDADWHWAFSNVPSLEQVQKVVTSFLNRWRGNPEVEPYYSSWKNINFIQELSPFGNSAAQQGQPCGGLPLHHKCYVRLDAIELVE